MSEEISFPNTPPARWVVDRDCVYFPAKHGARTIACLASLELLIDRFGVTYGDLRPSEKEVLTVYEKNRDRIQAIARARILAGKVTPDNELLLTTNDFAFEEVRFADKVKRSPYYFRLVRRVTGELETVVGQSMGQIRVRWEYAEDAQRRPLYILVVEDDTSRESAAFTPADLENEAALPARLSRLWGDLLQDQNHKQLQRIGAGQSED